MTVAAYSRYCLLLARLSRDFLLCFCVVCFFVLCFLVLGRGWAVA